MAKIRFAALAALVTGVTTLGAAFAAQAACDGAGVIVRIDGQPQEVLITRGAQTVSRPRVLEVICHNDVIKTTGATAIVLSVDGVGSVKVAHSVVYTVPARTGAPTAMGNAYRTINDQVMPDMKRLPWNVRLKGAGDDFGFALPALSQGGQQLTVGSRGLLVRLVGGTAPYKVEIHDAHGQVVASQTSESHEVALTGLSLAPGAYTLRAADSTPPSPWSTRRRQASPTSPTCPIRRFASPPRPRPWRATPRPPGRSRPNSNSPPRRRTASTATRSMS